ncbi:MAG: Gfo/Idh/MocA family oxidoreductase [Candidatus Latescibacterota bacterium]
MDIGIVGAENSHTIAIARLLNVEKRVRGLRVTHVWGETTALARQAAEAGGIPHIAASPVDMVGQVQAAVVDHRHAREHLPAAAPLLEARLPLFIDKPFCYRAREGRRFLARAAELGVPVCSFSTLPKQAAFLELERQARQLGPLHAVVATGPCDIRSRWGGIFFYGVHQVDMVLRLLGYNLAQAQVVRGAGRNHVAVLTFRSGAVATLNLIHGGRPAFHLSVVGEKGRLDQEIHSDESPFLKGVQEFSRMFRTGRTPETAQSMLGPVAVLEALEKSIAGRGRVKVTL